MAVPSPRPSLRAGFAANRRSVHHMEGDVIDFGLTDPTTSLSASSSHGFERSASFDIQAGALTSGLDRLKKEMSNKAARSRGRTVSTVHEEAEGSSLGSDCSSESSSDNEGHESDTDSESNTHLGQSFSHQPLTLPSPAEAQALMQRAAGQCSSEAGSWHLRRFSLSASALYLFLTNGPSVDLAEVEPFLTVPLGNIITHRLQPTWPAMHQPDLARALLQREHCRAVRKQIKRTMRPARRPRSLAFWRRGADASAALSCLSILLRSVPGLGEPERLQCLCLGLPTPAAAAQLNAALEQLVPAAARLCAQPPSSQPKRPSLHAELLPNPSPRASPMPKRAHKATPLSRASSARSSSTHSRTELNTIVPGHEDDPLPPPVSSSSTTASALPWRATSPLGGVDKNALQAQLAALALEASQQVKRRQALSPTRPRRASQSAPTSPQPSRRASNRRKSSRSRFGGSSEHLARDPRKSSLSSNIDRRSTAALVSAWHSADDLALFEEPDLAEPLPLPGLDVFGAGGSTQHLRSISPHPRALSGRTYGTRW
ncbi:uncharacterized protein MONBRDRAFT_11279 [Monosiga brevicollis MX1]|uniref:Uncharacterized protein n=1 Tax=Monosiga brevicollis TaxID=81824 RepID=A9V8R5_MONBE|nr:uncharacterized protein MONBRDRAFT_11279 [Monosiga brevicollis MX1]EDQ86130.1 predicted protein [Monosiga brevicollis MX1]|eukprot:XP_001749055.1 hypothetical protein [Monosiga brevicollis MX1]